MEMNAPALNANMNLSAAQFGNSNNANDPLAGPLGSSGVPSSGSSGAGTIAGLGSVAAP